MPWQKRITVGLWVAIAVLWVLCAWAVAALGTRSDFGALALATLVAAAPLTAGYLVIRHEPRNWVGTALTAAAAGLMLIMAHGNWQDALAEDPGSLPASPLLLVLTQGVWMAWFVPYALAVALFPDGRPFGKMGRLSVLGLLVLPVLFNALLAVVPGPLMPPLSDWPRPLGTHWIGHASLGVLPLFLACLVGATWSLARRHRAAQDSRAKAQLRWMLLAAGVLPATLVLCWVGYLVVGGPTPVVVGLVAMNLLIPAAAFVAMLRHDLYDVDTAIISAGVYALLTVGVLLGYAGVSWLVGVGLGEDSVTAAVTATVAVMVALLPARNLLLRLIGARLHPRRAAGLAAVAALAEQVNAGSAQPELLEERLRVALRDEGLRVGYRRPGDTAYLDLGGAEVSGDRARVVTAGGFDIALIVPGPQGSSVPSEVAAATALLADSVRLRQELARAVSQVEASRERLVTAGYAERRRLEMDLHDGAQQRLVSLGMRLRIAQRHARAGQPVDVDSLADDAVAEIASAVGELRAIAHGLRPSALDDGLAAALDGLTRHAVLPVEVRCPADDLPDQVGVTAYYVASESLANVVKHADATRVRIDVTREPEHVRLLVEDDGAGGARIVPGSGLDRLRDRVHAVGGSLALREGLDRGTVVEAVIPCAS